MRASLVKNKAEELTYLSTNIETIPLLSEKKTFAWKGLLTMFISFLAALYLVFLIKTIAVRANLKTN